MKERSPNAKTRDVLAAARASEATTGVSENIKAEVYGISAYFIERATSLAKQWLAVNPGKLLRDEQYSSASDKIERSIIEESESEWLLEDERNVDIDSAMKKIKLALQGTMHFQMKQLLNTDIPGPIVNEFDTKVQERLNNLLIEQKFRGGRHLGAETFLIGVTEPTAGFVITVYSAMLYTFTRQFNRLPSSTELTQLAVEVQKILKNMATTHLFDFSAFNSQVAFNPDPYKGAYAQSPLDAALTIDELDNGDYSIDLDTSIFNSDTEKNEPKVSCPALYARPDGESNTISFLSDYALHLILKSGLCQD